MAENFAGVIDQLRENKEAIDDSKEQNRISLSNVNKNLAFRLQNIGKDFSESVDMQQDAIQMQRQIADEQERARLLAESEGKDPVSGKDLGESSFSKTFSGLKALLGGVTLFFAGLLITIKALQDDLFKSAVGDLFRAIGDVFEDIIIPAGKALQPIATSILTYTVKGLTLFFESVLKVFEFLKDFNDNAAIEPEDYKGIAPLGALAVSRLARIKAALTGVSATTATVATAAEDANVKSTGIIQKTLDSLKVRLDAFKVSSAKALAPLTKTLTTLTAPIAAAFTSIRGGFMSISSRTKQLLSPLDKLRKTLTAVMAPLAKLPVISTVTNFFSAGGAKAGGFLKFLGKLFLPFTIIIGLVDTVKGFYAGFFGTDLEEGEEAPEGFIEKLMAGFEGGIKGLVNSIIGAPLDLLKGAVGFVLGKMGFTGAEEALASFRFSDILDQILSVIFNPIDSIVSLFRKIFDFDILGWLTENVPGFGKVIDFFTEDDVEAQMRTIRQNRDAQNQIEYLQDRLDEAQAKLDDPNFSGNREYQEQIIRDRQALIDQVRAETGLTVEGIPARIQELQTMAEATEGGDRERLLNRIAELQELQTELEDRNVVIVNTDNKQTQVNNNKGTVSVGKETTPNDQTYKALQTQYAIP